MDSYEPLHYDFLVLVCVIVEELRQKPVNG